jgi:formate dehydrogenase major subunit
MQDLATEYGASQDKYKGARRRYYSDDTHSKVLFESHKCILCGNCVRYCTEVKKIDCLGFVNRGFDTVVKPPLNMTLAESGFDKCTEVVDYCPTGAFSYKDRFGN